MVDLRLVVVAVVVAVVVVVVVVGWHARTYGALLCRYPPSTVVG